MNYLKMQKFIESKSGGFYTSSELDDIEYTTAKEFFDTIKLKFSTKSGNKGKFRKCDLEMGTCKTFNHR